MTIGQDIDALPMDIGEGRRRVGKVVALDWAATRTLLLAREE